MSDVTDLLDSVTQLRTGSGLGRARASVTALQTLMRMSPDDKRAVALLVAERAAPNLVERIEAGTGQDLTKAQVETVLDLLRRLDGDDLAELRETVTDAERRGTALRDVTRSAATAAATASGLEELVTDDTEDDEAAVAAPPSDDATPGPADDDHLPARRRLPPPRPDDAPDDLPPPTGDGGRGTAAAAATSAGAVAGATAATSRPSDPPRVEVTSDVTPDDEEDELADAARRAEEQAEAELARLEAEAEQLKADARRARTEAEEEIARLTAEHAAPEPDDTRSSTPSRAPDDSLFDDLPSVAPARRRDRGSARRAHSPVRRPRDARREDRARTPDLPLARAVADTANASAALRVLRSRWDETDGLDHRRVLEVVRAVPDGWARRRAIEDLLARDHFHGDEAADAIDLLDGDGDRRFVAGSVLARRHATAEQLRDVVDAATLERLARRGD